MPVDVVNITNDSRRNTVRNPCRFAALLVTTAAVLGTDLTRAETFTGRLNGYSCASGGHICPLDRLDPHIALETDFVLQTADGDYFFLTNVPRETKARYALEQIQVTGDLNSKYKTVVVDELNVERNGSYAPVWSQAGQMKEYKRFLETNQAGPAVGHAH